jgi:hypothetical protein
MKRSNAVRHLKAARERVDRMGKDAMTVPQLHLRVTGDDSANWRALGALYALGSVLVLVLVTLVIGVDAAGPARHEPGRRRAARFAQGPAQSERLRGAQ